MNRRVIIPVIVCLVLAVSIVLTPTILAKDIDWSVIHETDIKMNNNIWKASLNFTFSVTEIDAVAIRLYVNETPPSQNGSITLKNITGGMVFHNEPVVLTQDEIENNIWHIEYLTDTIAVQKGVNYSFSLRIHKNMEVLEPEPTSVGGELNFKFGFDMPPMAIDGGSITQTPIDDEPEQTETDDDTTCNITSAIFLTLALSFIAVGLVRHEK